MTRDRRDDCMYCTDSNAQAAQLLATVEDQAVEIASLALALRELSESSKALLDLTWSNFEAARTRHEAALKTADELLADYQGTAATQPRGANEAATDRNDAHPPGAAVGSSRPPSGGAP
jgi:hypothetical protein